jgi:hypothetical protein
VIANDVVQATNDKRQVASMLGKLGSLPGELCEIETLLADTGYFSEANVQACVAAEVNPLIAMGRQPHHPPLAERFAPGTVGAGQPDAGRRDGALPEDARRPSTLRPAQVHPRAAVRHHLLTSAGDLRLPALKTNGQPILVQANLAMNFVVSSKLPDFAISQTASRTLEVPAVLHGDLLFEAHD